MFWGDVFQSGMFARICDLSNQEPLRVLGVSTCMNGSDFDYYIAAETDQEKSADMNEFSRSMCCVKRRVKCQFMISCRS